MSALVQRSAPTGLLEKLVAHVRAEFRVGIYVADPDDPVLGRRPCMVAGCDRSRTAFGLCSGHDQRWRTRGCPDLAEFSADPGPAVNGRRELTHCTVPGCRYGSIGFGLLTPPHGLDPGGTAGFEDHGGPKARSSSGTASGAPRHESTFEGWRRNSRSSCSTPSSAATTRPRPGHDHRTATGRGLDDRPSPAGPSVLAAGSFARVVHELAGNKQGMYQRFLARRRRL